MREGTRDEKMPYLFQAGSEVVSTGRKSGHRDGEMYGQEEVNAQHGSREALGPLPRADPSGPVGHTASTTQIKPPVQRHRDVWP